MDWAGILRVGLCRLGLSPTQLWALTPAELMVLLGFDRGDTPMTLSRLQELSRAFPDDMKATVP